MSKAKDESAKASDKPTYRIPPDSSWATAWKVTAVVGGLGLAGALFGMVSDPKRFAFSWLFAFLTFLAVSLGGLFFVLGQHLTGAGWGVTSRRTAEMMLSAIPVFAILFIPIALNLEHLYPWMHIDVDGTGEAHAAAHGDAPGALGFGAAVQAQDVRELRDITPLEQAERAAREGHDAHAHTPQHAEHEHIVQEKQGYFHLGGRAVFFFIRAAIYFIAWTLLAFAFVGWSTRQDKERGVALTKKAQKLAPAATFVFGLTLTFAIFDWMMSLEPSWYSTIFGVQYFAVSAVIGHALIILLTLGIRRAGLIGDAINVEHFHDLGKLLFGFVVFWAYISFSQFMLIWYAGIPEEATYYHLRWWGGGGFKTVSILLVLAGFGVPFFLLMSRNLKRRLGILAFACIWLAVMHVVQMYWLVMPYAQQTGLVQTSMQVHWIDVAALLAVGGIYLSVVLWQLTRYPLVPLGDPRLARALKFENA